MPECQRHSLPTPVVDAVLQYLGSRPWIEVAQLIEAIRANAELVEPAASTPDTVSITEDAR